jgi:hypothetical protein
MTDIVIASDLFFSFIGLACAVVGYHVRLEIRYLSLARDIKETNACIKRIEEQLKATVNRIASMEERMDKFHKDFYICGDERGEKHHFSRSESQ